MKVLILQLSTGTGNDFFRLIADQNKSIEELITDLISYQSIRLIIVK